MELDDLKASWRSLDQRVSQLTAMNLMLLTERQTRKARGRLWPVWVGAIGNIVGGVFLTSVSVRFWLAHAGITSAVVAGLALQAASVGIIVVGVVELLILTRINYAQPVVTIQRYLALLRSWELHSFYGMWLGAWLLLPALMVACAMGMANVDLWARAPTVVLINIAAGIGSVLFWLFFHRWAHRPGGRVGAWLNRFLESPGIERARAAMDEIDRFARE